MANRNLNARQQQKHDTSSNFNSKNATYLEAEILIESDTGRVKIADGDTDYKTLPYTIGTRVPTDAKFTDTTYTASGGLSLSGTTFSIANSGVTADTYGPNANVSGSWGTSFTVPSVVVNTKGQVTSAVDRTVTMPAKPTAADIGAEPAFTKNTAFNKNFGTASGTVCEGDDERLSDARPASDVSAWAKAATKPTYTPTEVGVIGTAPTSGQVAVFDGTTGKIKSTGFTIASSVPSGAKFTDTTYSAATSTVLGLVKVGYTESGRNYPVELDADDKMFVNVPWTDTNTTYSQATSSTLGLIKIGYTESGKNYPIELNTSGQAYVNVPWEDTTYSVFTGATTTAAGTSGLVPAPTSGQSTRYLCSTGEWSIPTGTIYNGSTAISVKPSTTDGEYNIYLVALFPGTTSQSVGPSASGTINFGSAFNVPYITIDQYGRITALANRSMILSGALASSSAPGLCPKLDSGHPSYYLNANGTWSAPRGRVYGVKGNAETAYREGQVNITAANVGALPITGGTVSGATTFSDTVTLSTAGSITYDDGFYDG